MITFLHTSPVHVATFDKLLAELGPDVTASHIVDESLLAYARQFGAKDSHLIARVSATVRQAAEQGAKVVLCTCSTLGGVVEQLDTQGKYLAMRVDRPMADQAVALGPSILVVAALESTLAPTVELIQSSAERLAVTVSLTPIVVADAWHAFEQADMGTYFEQIARAVRQSVAGNSVVVLAQASMAGAQTLLDDIGVMVLSSPRLGVAAAVLAVAQPQAH